MSPRTSGDGAGEGSLGREEPGALEARLDHLRKRITQVDDELIRLIGERRRLVLDVGRIKDALGLPVLDPAREAAVVRKAARRAREVGVDEEMTRDVLWRIIASAREAQEEREGLPPSPTETSAPKGEGGHAEPSDEAASRD